MKKRIIDKRNKEKFFLDDQYLNGYARVCGWQSTLVYLCLCRHSNKDQLSFPSIKLMAEKVAVSRQTIIKGLQNLEKYNIIQVQKIRSKKGTWINNTYILLDKSEWIINHQVPVGDMDNTPHQVPVGSEPSPCGVKNQVPVGDTKEPQCKEPHIRRAADKNPLADNSVKELIDYFFTQTQSLKRIKPAINGGKDGAIIKRLLVSYTPQQLKSCINWFLKDQASDKLGPSIAVCFSATIINKFLANEEKHKWQYGE